MKEGFSGPLMKFRTASAITQGSRKPRRRISRTAGMKKMAGSKSSSSPGFPLMPRIISSTVIPFTRWEPTKAPALTPT